MFLPINRLTEPVRDLRSPVFCPKQGQLWGQISELLRDLSSQVLKTFKDGNSFGQPAPILVGLHGEKAFLYIQSRTLLFQFLSIVSCPPTIHHCEETMSFLSQRASSSALGRPEGPMLNSLYFATVFPMLEAGLGRGGCPKLDVVSRCDLVSAEQRRVITFLFDCLCSC